MHESDDHSDVHTAQPRLPRSATVYPIDALVRESNPSERAHSDAADLVRLVAELGPDAGIRGALRKVADEGRIEHHVCDVILDACGVRPIQVIKTVREATGLGLGAAKDITDTPGSTIIRGVAHQRARKIQRERVALGADVRVIASSARSPEADR